MNDKTKEQTRIEFEVKYPTPAGAMWNERAKCYVSTVRYAPNCPLALHNIRLETWQAAHEMYAPKWISVDDGMPRIGQAILSKDRLGRVYKTTFNGRSFKCDLVVWDHTPVVEWMPLPKQEQAE